MTPPRQSLVAVTSALRRNLLSRLDKVWAARPHTEIPMGHPPTDGGVFRQVMGVFPSAVSVVTAMDARGLPRGLTCSAVCSLSMAPPSLLICVNRRNRSLEAIRHSNGFVVNLLREGRDELSDLFASASSSKFARTDWRPGPASGLPYLAGDALAFVECGLQAEIVAGSHAILIGLVQESGISAPNDGPLVYWRRSYGRWADQNGRSGPVENLIRDSDSPRTAHPSEGERCSAKSYPVT